MRSWRRLRRPVSASTAIRRSTPLLMKRCWCLIRPTRAADGWPENRGHANISLTGYWTRQGQRCIHMSHHTATWSKCADRYNSTVLHGATRCGEAHIVGPELDRGEFLATREALRLEARTSKPSVTMSYVEIYNETVRDLLNPTTTSNRLVAFRKYRGQTSSCKSCISHADIDGATLSHWQSKTEPALPDAQCGIVAITRGAPAHRYHRNSRAPLTPTCSTSHRPHSRLSTARR